MYHKLRLSWIPSVIVIAGVLLIGSCKDEEEPKSNVSFTFAGDDALESDGTVEVDVELDKQLAEPVVISYTLSGTASADDYDISPAGGSITIPANTQFSTFAIELSDDGLDESDEDLIITLTAVAAGHAQIKPAFNVYTLNIEDTGVPADPSNISFAVSADTVLESEAGVMEIVISIDKALEESVVIGYTLSGTADKFTPTVDGDFDITPGDGNIIIPAGATQAVVEIDVFEDGVFEVDFDSEIFHETVILTLSDVVSGPGQLVEGQSTYTLNIYEDDMLVFLDWEGSGEANPDSVDMDMFLWLDDPADSPDDGFFIVNPDYVGGGITSGFESEAILLVAGGFPDADMGMSYIYYDGKEDTLNFSVEYLNFGGLLNGGEPYMLFEGQYTLENLNMWDTIDAPDPQIVQTLTKSGVDYINISDINEPASGSRMKTPRTTIKDRSKIVRGTQTVQRIKVPEKYIRERFRK